MGFNLLFLKVTEKTARCQQKLEEKQAENLQAIREKESQVQELTRRGSTAPQYPANPARGWRVPAESLINSTHTPPGAEKMSGWAGASAGANPRCCPPALPIPALDPPPHTTPLLTGDGTPSLEGTRLIPELLKLSRQEHSDSSALPWLLCLAQ